MSNGCGSKRVGIVSIDSVMGNSRWWEGQEKKLADDGYALKHVDVFQSKEEWPGFLDLRKVNKIVASLDWADALKRIDAAVGQLHEQGCADIVGVGASIGGVYVLLYRDGRETNDSVGSGGWFPKLKNSHLMTRVIGITPVLEYPPVVSEKGRRPTNIEGVTKPTLIILGKDDTGALPVADEDGRFKDRMKELIDADFENPALLLQIYNGAGHLFTHEDIPPFTFFDRVFWNPFYEKEESRDAMELVNKWLRETDSHM